MLPQYTRLFKYANEIFVIVQFSGINMSSVNHQSNSMMMIMILSTFSLLMSAPLPQSLYFLCHHHYHSTTTTNTTTNLSPMRLPVLPPPSRHCPLWPFTTAAAATPTTLTILLSPLPVTPPPPPLPLLTPLPVLHNYAIPNKTISIIQLLPRS